MTEIRQTLSCSSRDRKQCNFTNQSSMHIFLWCLGSPVLPPFIHSFIHSFINQLIPRHCSFLYCNADIIEPHYIISSPRSESPTERLIHRQFVDVSSPLHCTSSTAGMPELKLGLNDKLMFEATGRSQSR